MFSKKRFFISYTQKDKRWAEWIAWIIEELGYDVTIQLWDFLPGSNFVHNMDTAITQNNKIIIILSHSFLSSDFARSEFYSYYANDPVGRRRSIIPIKVDDCRPQGLLRSIVYEDISNLTQDEAQKKLTFILQSESTFSTRRKPPLPPLFPRINEHRPNYFRKLQVALDTKDINIALSVYQACLTADVHYIELGDPIIRSFGYEVIDKLSCLGGKEKITVEFSSSDWVDEDIATCHEAGVSRVQILNLNSRDRIEMAVSQARTLGVHITICYIPDQQDQSILELISESNCDALCIVRNIDSTTKKSSILQFAKYISTKTEKELFIAGGFGLRDMHLLVDYPFNTLIVGRSIVQSSDPLSVINEIMKGLCDEKFR